MENSTAKARIVTIDDSSFICETLTSWLQDKYDVKTFSNGRDGLDYLFDNGADLILLDYDMPEMTGYGVLMAIRANHATKNIPVAFLTAVTNPRMEEEMLERGANDYIRKPFDMPALNRTFQKLLPHDN